MKYLIVYLFLLFSSQIFSQNGVLIYGISDNIISENDLEAHNLRGRVKLCAFYQVWNVEDDSGKLVPQDRLMKSNEFNEQGNLLIQKLFHGDGKLKNIDRFEYEGNKKARGFMICYDGDTVSCKRRGTYTYDTAGGACAYYEYAFDENNSFTYCMEREIISEKEIVYTTNFNGFKDIVHEFYNEIGELDSLYSTDDSFGAPSTLSAKFFRDSNGLLLKTTTFGTSPQSSGNDMDGRLEILYSYDASARLKSYQKYKNDTLKKSVAFDTHGNILVESIFREGKLYMKLEYSYQYDEQANWIEKRKVRTFYKSKDYEKERAITFNEKRKILYY